MTAKLPDLHQVQSSNIHSVGHDGDALFVKFHNGGVFKYAGVSADKFEALRAAESIGSHFHSNIKRFHNGEKVT